MINNKIKIKNMKNNKNMKNKIKNNNINFQIIKNKQEDKYNF
jgi:hypothetical protein